MQYLKGVEFLTLLPAVVKFFTKHMKKEGNFWFTVLGYSDGKVTVAGGSILGQLVTLHVWAHVCNSSI